MVPRTGGYAYDVGVWGLSIVQGPIFCRAVPNPNVTIRNILHRRRAAAAVPGRGRGRRGHRGAGELLQLLMCKTCVNSKPESCVYSCGVLQGLVLHNTVGEPVPAHAPRAVARGRPPHVFLHGLQGPGVRGAPSQPAGEGLCRALLMIRSSAGARWEFRVCPRATHAQCVQVNSGTHVTPEA